MQLYAPAKINLSFEIKGRREDGFHEIETLMAPISLSDRLTIERGQTTGDIKFSCDDASLPDGEENLVVRAARLFQKATKIGAGVEIALEKKIPHGAGLGGGSSDAAATLLGLNELFETRLDQKELIRTCRSNWVRRSLLHSWFGGDLPGTRRDCRARKIAGEFQSPACETGFRRADAVGLREMERFPGTAGSGVRAPGVFRRALCE